MSESTPPTSFSHRMRPEIAGRRIASFIKRFGESHIYLAYHAAFPLALTPDLLYRIWANFQRDIHGEQLKIPWMAVADLLLSSLCHEVDHELYEMDATVRGNLLKDLKNSPNFGTRRINELSHFLLEYIGQHLKSLDTDIRDFARAQRWIALAYIRPSEAAEELAWALHSSLRQDDKVDQVRMASLIETLAEPLVEFTPLFICAKSTTQLVHGDKKGAAALLEEVTAENPLFQSLMTDLRIRAGSERRIAPQRVQTTRRALFLGLGGTGNEVVRRVKYEMLRHGYDLPIFQYLVLDTVAFNEDPGMTSLMHLRNGKEYLYIGGYNPNEILKRIDKWPVISHWWGYREQTNLVTVDEGAGQMRSVGRMGFFCHFTTIESRLEDMVREVMSGENREAALMSNFDIPSDKAPIIYLVFSLCGGTGSSLFFDVAYVLRKLFSYNNIKPIIVGLAMLPGPYLQDIQSIPQKERIQANTYAALQELERLHNMGLGIEPRPNGRDIWDVPYTTNFRVSSPDLPFDYIYLIDDTTTKGEHYSREQIYGLMSQAIFWLSGPSTASHFWERAKNLNSKTIASGGQTDASGRKHLTPYSSMGISTITSSTLQQSDGQAHLLDQLLRKENEKQRKMFLHGAECLLNFDRNTDQQVMSHLEAIDILGYGIDSDSQKQEDLNTQLDELLIQQVNPPERVPTNINYELAYIKTLHGLPVSLIRSMPELQKAYQIMNVVRNAPYLHLDYSDQVRAGYEPLVNIEKTAEQIVDLWKQVADDIGHSRSELAETILDQVINYERLRQADLHKMVQVLSPDDPLFDLIDAIENIISSVNKTPTVSVALKELSNLIGLLHAQGWVTINPGYGAQFDPTLHQMIGESKGPNWLKGQIIEMRRRGYIRRIVNQSPLVRKAWVIAAASS